MGKLFSKQSHKHSRSNSDPIKCVNMPKEKHLSLDYSMLERNRENFPSNYKGLVNIANIHKGPINTLTTFQPNYCISGGKDHTIVVQNLDVGKVEQIWTEHTKEVTKVQSHQKIVASASRDLSIKIWNIDHKNSITTLEGHQLVVTAVDFNSASTQLCSGSRDNSVRIWDLITETCLDESKLSRNLVTDLKWINGDNVIVQTSEDKMLKIWDTRLLEVVHSFPPQNQIQTCCDVSGNYCITGNNGFGGRGCEISLWDLRQHSKLVEVRGHSETISGCKFIDSPMSSRLFVSCSHDGSICLWQDNKNTPISREQLNVGTLTSIAELNGNTLLCGSIDEGMRVIRRAVSGRLVTV